MKNIIPDIVDEHRIHRGPLAGTTANGWNGAFIFRRNGATLAVISTDEGGWDHVSVSLNHRCPTYDELTFVKNLFFADDETVFHFWPPKVQHVNNHQYCLHLWRPQNLSIPLPPPEMVGLKELGQHS